jgi:hypothetical protein
VAEAKTADEARQLAEKLIDELLAAADPEQLEQARQMGMVLSLFAGQVEQAREKYNAATAADLEGREDIFENVVTHKLRDA